MKPLYKFPLTALLLCFVALSVHAGPPAPTLAAGEPLEWQFRVFLDSREIGTHAFRLRPDEGTLVLETEADFQVKFLFFTAYTYQHRNVEKWDAAGLVSISSRTDANGRIYEVTGTRQPEAFRLQSREGREDLPARLMTFAYWNPEILGQQRLLNAQTGAYEPVRVLDRGSCVVDYQGRTIPARRYDIVLDETPISVWYAEEGKLWLALESLTEGGRVLRYQPVRLPETVGTVVANANGV